MGKSFDTPESRLAAAGHPLPAPPEPRGCYAPFHRVPLTSRTELITISGQTPRIDNVAVAGVAAPGESLEPARAAARLAMLRVLSALALACEGALPLRLHVLRLRGYVRSSPDFGGHTAVLDAASELLHTAWPDDPLPARTAIGVPSLPDGAYIEIELDVLWQHPSA